MKQLITAATLLFLTLAACDKVDETTHFKLPQGLKDYFNYQVGSYWVFKDSVSGAIDSLYVTAYGNFSREAISTRGDNEVIRIDLREHHQFDPSSHEAWAIYLDAGDGSCYTRMDCPDICRYFAVGWPFGMGNNDTTQRSLMSGITVNGKAYSNVYRYRQVFPQYPSFDSTIEIWVNADSGFIKIIDPFWNQTSELQRSHIVR